MVPRGPALPTGLRASARRPVKAILAGLLFAAPFVLVPLLQSG